LIGKKSQVTIWIILGIILLAVIGGIILIKTTMFKSGLEGARERAIRIPQQLVPIKDFIDNCLEKTTLGGVLFIASRGGYFDLPNNYFKSFPTTSYWIYKGKNKSPNLDILKVELSKYIENQLDYCLNSVDVLNKDVGFGEKKIKAEINGNILIVFLDMKTSVRFGDSVLMLENYQVEFKDSNLLKSFTAAKNILDEVKNNNNLLNFVSIFNIADKHGFDVIIDSYNEDTYIFKLKDRLQEEYSLNFVVNFNT